MNPHLGRWALLCKGRQVGEPYVHHTLRLKTILPLLLPKQAKILEGQHDAGHDAVMTRMVYIEALRLAKETRSESGV